MSIVLFWPVLWWNLIRIARWQAHTGREGLFAVNCFGGIRLVRVDLMRRARMRRKVQLSIMSALFSR